MSLPHGPELLTPKSSSLASPESEDDQLVSFVDMIFGGKLTSILVCEKCKHISQTQEDFNDLSLSIKPDDYVKDRKRGRLRRFAKRITGFQSAALGIYSEKHRSSSVPPTAREIAKFPGIDEPPSRAEPRRRSLDIVAPGTSEEVTVNGGGGIEDLSPEGEATHSSAASEGGMDVVTVEETKHVGFSEQPKADNKSKKDREDDSWVKFGRRISMSIRLGKDRERKSRPTSAVEIREQKPKEDEERIASHSAPPTTSTPSSIASEVLHDLAPSDIQIKLESVQQSLERPKVFFRHSDSSLQPPSQPHSTSTSIPTPRFPAIHHITSKRPRSPQPPKPTPEETAYLRQVLADITPSSLNPFALFRSTGQYGNHVPASSSTSSSAHALWLKMGQLPSIEECLRMFTAVEILDGENMVGCRQCWKIANGLYSSAFPPDGERAEDESDSEGLKEEYTEPKQEMQTQELLPTNGRPLSAPPASFSLLPASVSNPTFPSFYHQSNLSDVVSISSLPTVDITPMSSFKSYPSSLLLRDDSSSLLLSPELPSDSHVPSLLLTPDEPPLAVPTFASFPEMSSDQNPAQNSMPPSSEIHLSVEVAPIPSISTTAPESPTSPLTARPDTQGDAGQLAAPYADALLHTPRVYHRRPKESDFYDSTCESSEPDSDASTSTSVFGHSPRSSPSLASPDLPSDPVVPHSKESSSASDKVPRSKQVIMCAAYKRYLIGTPPPVLVIHLKRFQRISRPYMMSFSQGFKKLDDYVTFPEFLDLTPFLAPKKEDFGLGRKRLSKIIRPKDKERCMYRLYAVVVHIGNMVCPA
jgi:hypothetical protein